MAENDTRQRARDDPRDHEVKLDIIMPTNQRRASMPLALEAGAVEDLPVLVEVLVASEGAEEEGEITATMTEISKSR